MVADTDADAMRMRDGLECTETSGTNEEKGSV
jgi:hypothetical protein